ncbi:MAG: EAL domain-containing protein [Blautia sp.]|nr:EAL domain-containing protein [Blautia sp.]
MYLLIRGISICHGQGKKAFVKAFSKAPAKAFLIVFICITLSFFLSVTGKTQDGQDTKKVVRVGWFESTLNHTDSFGRRSGYGYDYQQRIAAFTGWTYEYVEGGWSELFGMLKSGEIDLLSDISFTEERAGSILFSAEHMGSEEYHAFITRENTQINPDDFSTFNGKKVGMNKNSLQEGLFVEWEDKHDIHPDIVELTCNDVEAVALLKAGEIDVYVSLDSLGTSDDIVSVCKIGASDIYFGINKNRPDIKQGLDAAMNRILEDNRYFNEQLSEKYDNVQGVKGFLSNEEKQWVSDHGKIRVGYLDDFLPFSGSDPVSSNLTGALADFLEMARTVEKNAELTFEPRAYHTVKAALQALLENEVDCLFPLDLTLYDGEELGVIVSDPLVSTEMYLAVRTADHLEISASQERTAAVLEGDMNQEIFFLEHYPKWVTVDFKNETEAFQSLASGHTDCILISNYHLNHFSDICTKHRLSTVTTGEVMELCFAVRQKDYWLYSILNKLNRIIPESVINTLLVNYSFTDEKVTFGDFIRDNLPYVLFAASLLSLVFLLLLLLGMKERKKASEGSKLISETERDHLTNLYNRNYFFVYANRLYSENMEKPMDAIVVNIERFHIINTLNGREYGNQILRTIGEEIGLFTSETGGIAGRFESDRFDIYCPHFDDYQSLLDRLQNRIKAEITPSDILLRMGVMPWHKDVQPELMFDLARTACSMIKGNYGKHLMIYDEGMRLRDQREHILQNDLVRALEQHELEVYYQPKYYIQGDVPVLSSAEALIRWRHPELGMLMPNDFIPLFEKNGQIFDLDRYVWEEAARQISIWQKKYGLILPVSVNLSRIDIFTPNLFAILEDITSRNQIDRNNLKLEITESAYTQNADYLIGVINKLRDRGYEIEMDDFGSGYSSLNMLSSMPIDILKMDKAFIRNMEHNEKDIRFIELILEIAKNMKVPVIAEGVETETQIQLLKKLGCQLAQGYYFARPVSALVFEDTIMRWDSKPEK